MKETLEDKVKKLDYVHTEWGDTVSVNEVIKFGKELIQQTQEAVLGEVKKKGLRWYDEAYKHGTQADGSTTYAITTEKEFDNLIDHLTKDTSNTTISSDKEDNKQH